MKQIKKFIWPLFFGFSVLLLLPTNTFGQTTITIEPGDNWTDVRILTSSDPNREYYANTNYANYVRIAANAWTASGHPFSTRGLIKFDLSTIPTGSIIQNATLYLYSDPAYSSSSDAYGNSQLSGSNAVYFEQVTSDWNETTVTWNNQPSSNITDRIWFPASTSTTENIQVDLNSFVQSWVNDPATNYGMKMILENELYYRSRSYASEDHPDLAIRPKLVIAYEEPSHKVTWTDLVGVTVAPDNSLKKTAEHGDGNGGASSEEVLPAGTDGWAEMTVLETETTRYFGLSEWNASTNSNTINYSIQITSHTPNVFIYENGSKIVYRNHYTVGEVYRIERVGNTIHYKRNGQVFYTSAVPSTTDLMVDVSILHTDGTIHEARTSFGPLPIATPGTFSADSASFEGVYLSWEDNSNNETGFEIERSLTAGKDYTLVHTTAGNEDTYVDTGLEPDTQYYYRMRAISETDHSRYTPEISIKTRKYGGRPVIWKDLVGVDLQADNTLIKTASYGGDNGGAASEQILPAGADGWVEMTILETDKMRYLGLSVSGETGVGFAKMDYALQFANHTPHVNVFENGNRIGYAGFTPYYEPGEVFAIERKGTTVYYKRNGKTFYTSTVPSTTDLAVDVCILHPEGTIHEAKINFGQAPEKPSNLTASLSASNQVNLTWEDHADNETGFEIERSLTAGSGYALVHTAAANVVSYVDSGLAANTTYYYRIRAVNENAGSAYVAQTSITIPGEMKPLANLVQNRPVD